MYNSQIQIAVYIYTNINQDIQWLVAIKGCVLVSILHHFFDRLFGCVVDGRFKHIKMI